ncbi:hypothetical protein FRC12_018385 [Ceratobasidium sp. 428]|nr:hypothetical protein FRC12_018385 [Ceratobasidium sp. 428]
MDDEARVDDVRVIVEGTVEVVASDVRVVSEVVGAGDVEVVDTSTDVDSEEEEEVTSAVEEPLGVEKSECEWRERVRVEVAVGDVESVGAGVITVGVIEVGNVDVTSSTVDDGRVDDQCQVLEVRVKVCVAVLDEPAVRPKVRDASVAISHRKK